MTQTYTLQQMLGIWKMQRGLMPMRSDGVTVRTDGIDLDALLTLDINSWYARLLDTADPRLLGVTDISADVALLRQTDGSGLIVLPETVRRVVEVKLGGWERPARLVLDDDDPIRYFQMSSYTRGGCIDPVCALEHRRLRLYTPPDYEAHPAVERLMVINHPDGATYTFDPSLLEFGI